MGRTLRALYIVAVRSAASLQQPSQVCSQAGFRARGATAWRAVNTWRARMPARQLAAYTQVCGAHPYPSAGLPAFRAMGVGPRIAQPARAPKTGVPVCLQAVSVPHGSRRLSVSRPATCYRLDRSHAPCLHRLRSHSHARPRVHSPPRPPHHRSCNPPQRPSAAA